MGNIFPKRFKYDPSEYADFKTTTNGGSLKSFLFWKLETELKLEPSEAFDSLIAYMVDIIPRLEINQDQYYSMIFEVYKENNTLYTRLAKFPA